MRRGGGREEMKRKGSVERGAEFQKRNNGKKKKSQIYTDKGAETMIHCSDASVDSFPVENILSDFCLRYCFASRMLISLSFSL